MSCVVLGVFTAPLRSNGRGADHIENNLSLVKACLPRTRVYLVVAYYGSTRHIVLRKAELIELSII
jgi:hypothetical protein